MKNRQALSVKVIPSREMNSRSSRQVNQLASLSRPNSLVTWSSDSLYGNIRDRISPTPDSRDRIYTSAIIIQ